MVDSIIVGKFVGTTAFAAIGCTGSITFLVLGLMMGCCSGFAIPVAQDFGAQDMAGVRRCVANIIYIGAALVLLLTMSTTLLTRQILLWMDTQESMLQDAYDYLFWIFLGIGAQFLYNILAGILRSLSDSRTPLYFLICSCLINIVLDLLLVKVIGIGVKGAAIATVISQLISGLACLVLIIRKFPMLHLTKTDLVPHKATLLRLFNIGVPMGLQFSITAIGSILLQKSVNGLDAASVAAVAAGVKVQGLLVSPMDAFGVAIATYSGQNYGARRIDRIKKGVLEVYGILFIYSMIALTINYFFSNKIALLFMNANETVILGLLKRWLLCNGVFYWVVAVIYVLRNTLQGVGFSKVAMLAGVFELIARAIMGLWLVPWLGFRAVCFANPFAWLMADVILLPLYIGIMRKLKNAMAEG